MFIPIVNRIVVLKFNYLLDINECDTSSHGCEQICNNLPGSYECICHHGLQIDPTNDKKCIGEWFMWNKLKIKIVYICIIANRETLSKIEHFTLELYLFDSIQHLLTMIMLFTLLFFQFQSNLHW